MELPSKLKELYRHWNFHILTNNLSAETASASKYLSEELLWFIDERLSIWKKKIDGTPAPYTADPILAHYRFCNIYREFDRQTISFHTLLNPLRDDFSLWLLNMFYCRMVARTETIAHVGLLSFDAGENEKFYKRLMHSPRPRFGTPYVFPISTIQRSDTPTRELCIAKHLPSSMKAVAAEIETWERLSVFEGVQRVLPIFGYNLAFLWTEVLIDAAYQFPERIDLFARFPIGPGSLPTFKNIAPEKDPSLLVAELALTAVDTGITYDRNPIRLSAENWEGIGCEYRKYRNLRSGKGRRRIYKK